MSNKSIRAVLGLGLVFVLAGALPSAPEAAPQNMVLGTAPAGTSSFAYMVGVATIINKQLPNDFKLSPQETGGSVANIRLLDAGKIQVSGFSGMVAAQAIAGKAPFKQKFKVNVLFNMYPQIFFWFARKDTNIKSWDQVPGKKMVAGVPGGSTRVVGDLVVNAKSLRDKATILYLRPNAMLDSLRDKNVDGGYGLITGTSPAPWVQEVMASLDVTFFGLDPATATKLSDATPGLNQYEAPAGMLKGVPAFTTVTEHLIAGAASNMDDRTAYLITKTIQENLATLAQYSPAAKGAKPEDALKGVPKGVPFHPGAIRYYKEKGLMK
jgi:hypothetical protein